MSFGFPSCFSSGSGLERNEKETKMLSTTNTKYYSTSSKKREGERKETERKIKTWKKERESATGSCLDCFTHFLSHVAHTQHIEHPTHFIQFKSGVKAGATFGQNSPPIYEGKEPVPEVTLSLLTCRYQRSEKCIYSKKVSTK